MVKQVEIILVVLFQFQQMVKSLQLEENIIVIEVTKHMPDMFVYMKIKMEHGLKSDQI